MRLAALVAAVAAAVAAALDLLVLGLLHLVSPEVDPVSRPVSEYALGDFRWLARSGRLLKVLRRSRSRWPCAARAAALLLVVVGLLKLAIPLFPVDALGMPATPAGQMHNVLGNVTFFLFPLAALLLFRALRRRGSRLTPGIAVVLAIATVGVLVGNAAGGSAWPNVPTSFFPRSGYSSPL